MSSITLRIFSWLWLLPLATSQQIRNLCTQHQVDYCMSALDAYDLSTVIPLYEEDVLKPLCNDYKITEACLEPIKPHCSPTIQLLFEGTEDAFAYICDATYDEYLSHYDCLANANVQFGGNQCNESFVRQVDEISTDSDTFSEKVCDVADEYAECLFDAVSIICGDEAGTWVQEYQERSIEPLLGYTDCRYRGSGFSTADILPVVIAVSVILLFLVSIIAVCLGRRSRHKSIRNQEPGVYYSSHPADPQSSNYPAPPPSVMIGVPPPDVSASSPPPYTTYNKPPAYEDIMRDGPPGVGGPEPTSEQTYLTPVSSAKNPPQST